MKILEDKPAPRFLVVSTTGIGDILMGTPALRVLRESFPSSEIHLLVNSKRKDLVRHNPHVDRVLGYRNNPGSRALLFCQTVFTYYDYVLVFHSNEDILKILRVVRYGTSFNRQRYEDRGRRLFPLASLPTHSIQKRLALVEKVGGKEIPDYRYEYAVPASGVRWASARLEQRGISLRDPIVGMQLGAADFFKCWPVEFFVEVARYLRSKHGAKIYLNLSPPERALGERFRQLFGSQDVICHPGEDLSHSAALIQRCTLFITPDTGPMHVAIGLGIPLIGLFCPTEVEETGPLAYEKAVVIRKPKTCDPCRSRECPDNHCMRQITVREVCLAADHLLRNDFRGREEDRV
jgi:ADP-heptose:LPS heptosyltransferase